MRRYSSFLGIIVSVLFLCMPASRAQDGLRGALSRYAPGARSYWGLDQRLAAADFDSDEKPDGAVLLDAGQTEGIRTFRVELHVTRGRNASLEFTSPEADLSISAVDVNRDGAPDIVVEKSFTHHRVQVYLNNGHGEFESTTAWLAAPDDSGPAWHGGAIFQNPTVDSLPPTRGYELAANKATTILRLQDAKCPRCRLDVFVFDCGARAPASSRAPPSNLPL